jgi:hypothetical protein
MFMPKGKRYHVVLLQPPVLTNDLGEVSETGLYKFVPGKLDAIAIERLMFHLHYNRTARAEFTTSGGFESPPRNYGNLAV